METPPTANAFALAVESAIADSDYERAVELLSSGWPQHVALHGSRIRALIESLPPAAWQSDPWLVIAMAATHGTPTSLTRDAAVPYLNAADVLLAGAPDTPLQTVVEIALHRAAALRGLGQLQRARTAVVAARRALTWSSELPDDERDRLQAHVALQTGLVDLHFGGYDSADEQLRLAMGHAGSRLNLEERVECFGASAYLAYTLGDLREATALIGMARDAAYSSEDAPILLAGRFAAPMLLTEALVAVERADVAAARSVARVVRRACRNSEWELLGLHAEAAIAAISGEYLEGLEILRLMFTTERAWEPAGAATDIRLALKCSLLARLGDTETAHSMLRHLKATGHHATCPAVQGGRLRIQAHDYPGALHEITPCTALGDAHSDRTNVDVLLIRSAAHYGLGNPEQGDTAFDSAVLLAKRGEARRPFELFPAASLLPMIERALHRQQHEHLRGFLVELCDAVRARSPQHPLRQLTSPLSSQSPS